ncbi:MAG: Ldh family oxidoreductase [Candidatus Geothermarchaeales archaeon]
MPTFTADQLREVCSKILEAAGASKDEAGIVADHLVKSNLYGHDSHGVLRIPWYIKLIEEGSIRPGAEVKVLRETEATALLDGNWGFGQVVARDAMERAIEKAGRCGVGVVALFHCFHIGRLGEYSAMAVERGMIGIVLCNAPPNVAPFGGRKALIGTNPISIAAPTAEGRPIILDMATSVAAAGKVSLALERRQRVPEGWIIDSEGNPTTNPADFRPRLVDLVSARGPIKMGALLPVGGYKGYGLGLIIEVLGGVLAGAGVSHECGGNGVVTMAIDVGAFRPLEEFKRTTSELVKIIKDSPKAPGFEEILVAGEPEFRAEEQRLKEGIFVEDATWSALVEIAEELGTSLGNLG